MSAAQFIAIRARLGLSREQVAKTLGLQGGARTVEAFEDGAAIPAAVALAWEALGSGWRPAHLRASPALAVAA